MMEKKGRIVGIGGIFFKTSDPKATKSWYADHLGMKTSDWGASFVARKFSKPEHKTQLEWSPFAKDTDYFGNAEQQYMINYRVEHIEALVEELRSQGVQIVDDIATYDYGKFVHIIDCNGTKVELWEAVDEVFDEMQPDENLFNKE